MIDRYFFGPGLLPWRSPRPRGYTRRPETQRLHDPYLPFHNAATHPRQTAPSPPPSAGMGEVVRGSDESWGLVRCD